MQATQNYSPLKKYIKIKGSRPISSQNGRELRRVQSNNTINRRQVFENQQPADKLEKQDFQFLTEKKKQGQLFTVQKFQPSRPTSVGIRNKRAVTANSAQRSEKDRKKLTQQHKIYIPKEVMNLSSTFSKSHKLMKQNLMQSSNNGNVNSNGNSKSNYIYNQNYNNQNFIVSSHDKGFFSQSKKKNYDYYQGDPGAWKNNNNNSNQISGNSLSFTNTFSRSGQKSYSNLRNLILSKMEENNNLRANLFQKQIMNLGDSTYKNIVENSDGFQNFNYSRQIEDVDQSIIQQENGEKIRDSILFQSQNKQGKIENQDKIQPQPDFPILKIGTVKRDSKGLTFTIIEHLTEELLLDFLYNKDKIQTRQNYLYQEIMNTAKDLGMSTITQIIKNRDILLYAMTGGFIPPDYWYNIHYRLSNQFYFYNDRTGEKMKRHPQFQQIIKLINSHNQNEYSVIQPVDFDFFYYQFIEFYKQGMRIADMKTKKEKSFYVQSEKAIRDLKCVCNYQQFEQCQDIIFKATQPPQGYKLVRHNKTRQIQFLNEQNGQYYNYHPNLDYIKSICIDQLNNHYYVIPNIQKEELKNYIDNKWIDNAKQDFLNRYSEILGFKTQNDLHKFFDYLWERMSDDSKFYHFVQFFKNNKIGFLDISTNQTMDKPVGIDKYHLEKQFDKMPTILENDYRDFIEGNRININIYKTIIKILQDLEAIDQDCQKFTEDDLENNIEKIKETLELIFSDNRFQFYRGIVYWKSQKIRFQHQVTFQIYDKFPRFWEEKDEKNEIDQNNEDQIDLTKKLQKLDFLERQVKVLPQLNKQDIYNFVHNKQGTSQDTKKQLELYCAKLYLSDLDVRKQFLPVLQQLCSYNPKEWIRVKVLLSKQIKFKSTKANIYIDYPPSFPKNDEEIEQIYLELPYITLEDISNFINEEYVDQEKEKELKLFLQLKRIQYCDKHLHQDIFLEILDYAKKYKRVKMLKSQKICYIQTSLQIATDKLQFSMQNDHNLDYLDQIGGNYVQEEESHPITASQRNLRRLNNQNFSESVQKLYFDPKSDQLQILKHFKEEDLIDYYNGLISNQPYKRLNPYDLQHINQILEKGLKLITNEDKLLFFKVAKSAILHPDNVEQNRIYIKGNMGYANVNEQRIGSIYPLKFPSKTDQQDINIETDFLTENDINDFLNEQIISLHKQKELDKLSRYLDLETQQQKKEFKSLFLKATLNPDNQWTRKINLVTRKIRYHNIKTKEIEKYPPEFPKENHLDYQWTQIEYLNKADIEAYFSGFLGNLDSYQELNKYVQILGIDEEDKEQYKELFMLLLEQDKMNPKIRVKKLQNFKVCYLGVSGTFFENNPNFGLIQQKFWSQKREEQKKLEEMRKMYEDEIYKEQKKIKGFSQNKLPYIRELRKIYKSDIDQYFEKYASLDKSIKQHIQLIMENLGLVNFSEQLLFREKIYKYLESAQGFSYIRISYQNIFGYIQKKTFQQLFPRHQKISEIVSEKDIQILLNEVQLTEFELPTQKQKQTFLYITIDFITEYDLEKYMQGKLNNYKKKYELDIYFEKWMNITDMQEKIKVQEFVKKYLINYEESKWEKRVYMGTQEIIYISLDGKIKRNLPPQFPNDDEILTFEKQNIMLILQTSSIKFNFPQLKQTIQGEITIDEYFTDLDLQKKDFKSFNYECQSLTQEQISALKSNKKLIQEQIYSLKEKSGDEWEQVGNTSGKFKNSNFFGNSQNNEIQSQLESKLFPINYIIAQDKQFINLLKFQNFDQEINIQELQQIKENGYIQLPFLQIQDFERYFKKDKNQSVNDQFQIKKLFNDVLQVQHIYEQEIFYPVLVQILKENESKQIKRVITEKNIGFWDENQQDVDKKFSEIPPQKLDQQELEQLAVELSDITNDDLDRFIQCDLKYYLQYSQDQEENQNQKQQQLQEQFLQQNEQKQEKQMPEQIQENQQKQNDMENQQKDDQNQQIKKNEKNQNNTCNQKDEAQIMNWKEKMQYLQELCSFYDLNTKELRIQNKNILQQCIDLIDKDDGQKWKRFKYIYSKKIVYRKQDDKNCLEKDQHPNFPKQSQVLKKIEKQQSLEEENQEFLSNNKIVNSLGQNQNKKNSQNQNIDINKKENDPNKIIKNEQNIKKFGKSNSKGSLGSNRSDSKGEKKNSNLIKKQIKIPKNKEEEASFQKQISFEQKIPALKKLRHLEEKDLQDYIQYLKTVDEEDEQKNQGKDFDQLDQILEKGQNQSEITEINYKQLKILSNYLHCKRGWEVYLFQKIIQKFLFVECNVVVGKSQMFEYQQQKQSQKNIKYKKNLKDQLQGKSQILYQLLTQYTRVICPDLNKVGYIKNTDLENLKKITSNRQQWIKKFQSVFRETLPNFPEKNLIKQFSVRMGPIKIDNFQLFVENGGTLKLPKNQRKKYEFSYLDYEQQIDEFQLKDLCLKLNLSNSQEIKEFQDYLKKCITYDSNVYTKKIYLASREFSYKNVKNNKKLSKPPNYPSNSELQALSIKLKEFREKNKQIPVKKLNEFGMEILPFIIQEDLQLYQKKEVLEGEEPSEYLLLKLNYLDKFMDTYKEQGLDCLQKKQIMINLFSPYFLSYNENEQLVRDLEGNVGYCSSERNKLHFKKQNQASQELIKKLQKSICYSIESVYVQEFDEFLTYNDEKLAKLLQYQGQNINLQKWEKIYFLNEICLKLKINKQTERNIFKNVIQELIFGFDTNQWQRGRYFDGFRPIYKNIQDNSIVKYSPVWPNQQKYSRLYAKIQPFSVQVLENYLKDGKIVNNQQNSVLQKNDQNQEKLENINDEEKKKLQIDQQNSLKENNFQDKIGETQNEYIDKKYEQYFEKLGWFGFDQDKKAKLVECYKKYLEEVYPNNQEYPVIVLANKNVYFYRKSDKQFHKYPTILNELQ